MCDRQRTAGGPAPLDQAAWHRRVDELAGEGERVLAVATKTVDPNQRTLTFADVEGGLELLGLLGLIDPPREEAVAAVAECRRAGIRVKMITGDHAATARSIAGQVGLENTGEVLTGADLDRLDARELPVQAAQGRCVRPHEPGAQDRVGRGAPGPRGCGRDDRRRGERCACPQAGRRRGCDGAQGHRGGQGGGGDRAPGRQLRLDRRGSARRADGLRQSQEGDHLPAADQRRRGAAQSSPRSSRARPCRSRPCKSSGSTWSARWHSR